MPADGLLGYLRRRWKLLVLRGVLAVLLGILAFAWPGLTLLALATLWGVYALVDGVVALVTAVKARDEGPVWPLVLIGLVGIAAGGFSLVRPDITALVILAFIAVWAVLIGIMQVVLAMRLRREISGEWLLALSGVLSIFFGLATVRNPQWGATVVGWVVGTYAFLFGLLLIALGLRLRGMGKRVGERFAALVLLTLLIHGCSSAQQPAITVEPTGTQLPGKFVWHDLLTGDPVGAQRFYAGLFGWRFRPSRSDEYTVVTQAGRPIGGILDTRKGKTDHTSQWLGSVSVADVDSAVGVVRAGGGKVLWGPRDLGPRGQVAVVADGQKARLSSCARRRETPPTPHRM
jgi:uncharacterized membrane protein HdeD (DUF308 family)/predicted enzyme related to lactoylglutathione lyase